NGTRENEATKNLRRSRATKQQQSETEQQKQASINFVSTVLNEELPKMTATTTVRSSDAVDKDEDDDNEY
mgnify:CR=1